jgi:N6-L-threonylcarbamoyladenine synthase
MLILGIETSCDETSAAVVRDGVTVLSCVISSSKHDFVSVGGVIPEEAARRQLEVILPVIEKSLADAQITSRDIDAIAVTSGPGLLGSLLVGTTTARGLAVVWGRPLIPVHHTLGHLSSTWLTQEPKKLEPLFPILTLSVSGGHTDLWHRTSHTHGSLIGSTRDDAAGEAFDKGAVLLGLPYPGGPALSKLAEGGNSTRFTFPTPLKHDGSLGFSFSGLKTSLKYTLRDLGESAKDAQALKDLAAGYQSAICAHLTDKLETAMKRYADVREVHIVGGVSANTKLREEVGALCKGRGMIARFPETLRYCTDNGAMIAAAGEFLVREQPSMLRGLMETRATIPLASVLNPRT